MTQESKPGIFSGDLAQLPPALQWLTGQRRWVVWRWVKRVTAGGKVKWTKPPYQPTFPNVPAKSNDPSTWGSYEEALAALAWSGTDGIGVMLLKGELAAADLDCCRDPETGELFGWAIRLCVEAGELGLYCEVTVSGRGLRFIGLSHQGAELHRRFAFNRNGAGLELYRNCARFITISGLQEGPCETMGEIDGYLDQLLARFDAQPTQPTLLDLNNAAPQTDYFREILENGVDEGQRSERFAEIVWHFAGEGMSIEEICRRDRQAPERNRRQICRSSARRGDAVFQQVENPAPGRRHRDGRRADGICDFRRGKSIRLAADQGDPERTAADCQRSRGRPAAVGAGILSARRHAGAPGHRNHRQQGRQDGGLAIDSGHAPLFGRDAVLCRSIRASRRTRQSQGLEADRRPGQGRKCASVPPRQMEAAGPQRHRAGAVPAQRRLAARNAGL